MSTRYGASYVQQVSGGTQSLTVTPSGGLQTGGAAVQTFGKVQSVSGGATFSGTAPVIKISLQYVMVTPSGGLIFAGSAPTSNNSFQSVIITPSGGLTIAGTTSAKRGYVKPANGGVYFNGSGSIVRFPDNSSTTTHNFKRGRRPRTRVNY